VGGSRTKDNLIISSTGASEGAGGIILGVTISIGAPILEEFGERSSRTASGIAAVFVAFVDSTWVVATAIGLKLSGTLSVNVSAA